MLAHSHHHVYATPIIPFFTLSNISPLNENSDLSFTNKREKLLKKNKFSKEYVVEKLFENDICQKKKLVPFRVLVINAWHIHK